MTGSALREIFTLANEFKEDDRLVGRIKVEWARQQIEAYGRDNPWVQVNVLGQFPPASLNARR
jgi:hypothetical protein